MTERETATGGGHERYEALSLEWVNALREYVNKRVRPEDLVGIKGSVSMEMTNPPKHILRYGLDRVAWSARVQDGKLEIFDRPIPDADGRVVSDYAFGVAGMKVSSKNELEFLEANRDKLTVFGSPASVEPIFIRINIRDGFFNVYTA